MFRLGIAVLAIVGLVSLLSGTAGWVAVGGIALLAPLFFIFKIMLFFMIFGMFKGAFAHRHGHHSDRFPWDRRPRRRDTRSDGPSDEERFEEWHRIQHARDEVDSWVDPNLDEL